MKTNKQVINDLVEYFLTQDPKVVARSLAATMIDLQRIVHIDELPDDERMCLRLRIGANVAALKKFAKDGPDGNLILHNLESGNGE